MVGLWETCGMAAQSGYRKHRHGSIATDRKLSPIVAIFAVLALTTVPAAQASPLLSGYGSPGQGSQVLLGSALLNGPSGGAGPAGGAGGGGGAPTSAQAGGAASPSGGSASASAPAGRSGGRRPTAGARDTAGGVAGVYARSQRGVGRPPLGVSREDLAYMIAALAVLALTGWLTARLQASRRRGAGTAPQRRTG